MEQKHIIVLLLIFGAISSFINILPEIVNLNPFFTGFMVKEVPLKSIAPISHADITFIFIAIAAFGGILSLSYANKKIKMKIYEKKNKDKEIIERIMSSIKVYDVDYKSILDGLNKNERCDGELKSNLGGGREWVMPAEIEKIKHADNIKTLTEFVKNKMVHGVPKEKIKKELLKHGWDKSFLNYVDDVKLTTKDIKKMVEHTIKEHIKQGYQVNHIEEALYKRGWKEDIIKPIINAIKIEHDL